MNYLKIPEWLHTGYERPEGRTIESESLALHFSRRPTKEMVANAAKKETTT